VPEVEPFPRPALGGWLSLIAPGGRVVGDRGGSSPALQKIHLAIDQGLGISFVSWVHILVSVVHERAVLLLFVQHV
jgi:hypothetical protein